MNNISHINSILQHGEKIKLLVAGDDLKFFHLLQRKLEASGKFDIFIDEWQGHNQHNEKRSLELLEKADIIFCEWCLGNIKWYSHHKKPHQRLVARFHLQERMASYLEDSNWDSINHIGYVSKYVQKEGQITFGFPIDRTSVIANLIDENKFIPNNKTQNTRYTLGIVGIAPKRKRFDRAIDLLEILLKKDNRYSLRVKGKNPFEYNWLLKRDDEVTYYREVFKRINSSKTLRNKVIFDPHNDNVNEWFSLVGYILSPSDFESFHMAIGEGMLTGTVPIIWNWDGASDIWPSKYIANNTKEAADLIYKYSNEDRVLLRSYVIDNYLSNELALKWQEIITGKSSNDIRKKILIVYSIDSFEMFHRREMLLSLAEKLKSEMNILIIEPGTHYKTLLNKNMESEENLKKYAEIIPIQVADNLYKIRVLCSGFSADIKVNDILKRAKNYEDAIHCVINYIFGENIEIIHYLYKPNHMKFIREHQKFFYEVYDEYTMDFKTGELFKDIADAEYEVLKKAECTFFTSEVLSQRKNRYCKSFKTISNGVAFDIFRKYAQSNEKNKRKSIGYLGNLSNFFDWQLMLNICVKMTEYDFFFHGQVELDRLKDIENIVSELMSLPNTTFSGRVTREDGAKYINKYDALIIPFIVNEAIHAVNPLKLWEYFATGKPVVSTPMNALNHISYPYLRITSGVDDWIKALIEATNEDDAIIKEERIQMAKNVSWDVISGEYAEVILNATNT